MQPTPNEVVYSGDAAKYALKLRLDDHGNEAGTQDSGLFFCASYENDFVVFLASPAKSAGV
jgi:hypothetical protein